MIGHCGLPRNQMTPEEKDDAIKVNLLEKTKSVQANKCMNKKRKEMSNKKKKDELPITTEAKIPQRRNYSKGEDLKKVKKAIECWENKTDECIDINEKPRSLESYC